MLNREITWAMALSALHRSGSDVNATD